MTGPRFRYVSVRDLYRKPSCGTLPVLFYSYLFLSLPISRFAGSKFLADDRRLLSGIDAVEVSGVNTLMLEFPRDLPVASNEGISDQDLSPTVSLDKFLGSLYLELYAVGKGYFHSRGIRVRIKVKLL